MKTTVYLHSNKESNHDKGVELGLKGKALEMFKFCLYEVAFELEINENTGMFDILSVDGRKFEEKKL